MKYLLILTLGTFGCASFMEEPNRDPAQVDGRVETPQGTTSKKAKKKSKTQSERIAAGYMIRISNLEDQTLNGKFRVDHEGMLELPYKVKLLAAGLSRNELRAKIIASYRKFYRSPPNIQLTIEDRKYYVVVAGLVTKPGPYLVKKTATLDEIIGLAEGLQRNALNETTAKYVRIQSGRQTALVKLSEYYSGKSRIIPAWQGMEEIFFQNEGADVASGAPESLDYVQVLGQVRFPGEYGFRGGADFFHYLTRSGGPVTDSNLDRIEIVRFEEGVRKAYEFEMDDLDDHPKILGGDIIIVHAVQTTAAERNIGIITNIITAIATILLVIVAL